jgi:hypothetical protein
MKWLHYSVLAVVFSVAGATPFLHTSNLLSYTDGAKSAALAGE